MGDGDTGRCVCLACCRIVITSGNDVAPLWEKVINFFKGPLGLLTSEESLMLNDPNYLGHVGPCDTNRRGVTNFPATDPLPLRVEERLDQLVAHLFLTEGLDPAEGRQGASASASGGTASETTAATGGNAATGDPPNPWRNLPPSSGRGGTSRSRTTAAAREDAGPSDEKLRQYF